jgi:catechol 2,3-dioxygenase-like lactoylglutathione lyase family enzyme
MEEQTRIGAMTPLRIVADVEASVAFYGRIGFAPIYREEGFAMLARDGAALMVKAVDEVPPLPNPIRHPWVKWDAYVFTADPEALAAEFGVADISLLHAVGDTSDGLRGFAVADPDGYVLFFGCPHQG